MKILATLAVILFTVMSVVAYLFFNWVVFPQIVYKIFF